ncbi:MAG: CpsD/CapB family tyrosine-protein kinase, partial [Clostridia bacterium]|nr:CpsD/CapB family tyrosine-protein kinase [Clostridia bacterium]
MAESRKERAAQAKQREFLCEHLSFAGKEAYKRLRTNLQFSFPEGESECNVVGITSSQPSEGKSLTSINLAFSLAQLDKRVLLIDADMRRSSIDTKLDVDLKPGLSNLLTDVNSSGGTIKKYVPEDESVGFSIITA